MLRIPLYKLLNSDPDFRAGRFLLAISKHRYHLAGFLCAQSGVLHRIPAMSGEVFVETIVRANPLGLKIGYGVTGQLRLWIAGIRQIPMHFMDSDPQINPQTFNESLGRMYGAIICPAHGRPKFGLGCSWPSSEFSRYVDEVSAANHRG